MLFRSITVGSVLLCLTQLQICLAASCETYTVSAYEGSEDTFTQPALETIIVSKGVVCPSTSPQCSVSIEGYVTDSRTLNITTDSSTSASIFNLISTKIGIPFNETTTTSLDHISGWPINNGTAGYVGFTPNHRCTRGILSQCNSNNLEGVSVEACTPYSNSPGGGLSGTLATISTSVQAAQALTCNPANTTAAMNGQNPSNCSSSESGTAPSDGNTGGAGAASGVCLSLLLACVAFALLEVVPR